MLAPAGVWLLASACGPGVATPMPEPPSAFDLGGVHVPEITPANQPQDPRVLVLPGAPGTVPGGAIVRVTNLDSSDPVATSSALANGSFMTSIIVADGQELRFEWVDGEERSAPGDARVSRPDPAGQAFSLTEAPRFDCVELSPGFALSFAENTAQSLRVRNGCKSGVSLSNARTRLNLPDFALSAALPQAIAAGATATIEVSFERNASGPREDVLFVDFTLDGETLRYPITLRAEQ